MKIINAILAVMFLVGVMISYSFAQPQTEVKQERFLVFENAEKEVIKDLPENRKVKIWFKDAARKPVKGRFTVVNDSTIQVDSQMIPMSAILRMRVPFRTAKIVGGVISSVGLTFIGGGAGVVYYATTLSGWDGLGVAILGLFISVVGIIPTIVGIPFLFLGKKFDTRKGWKFSLD